jgi:hypothetical protein
MGLPPLGLTVSAACADNSWLFKYIAGTIAAVAARCANGRVTKLVARVLRDKEYFGDWVPAVDGLVAYAQDVAGFARNRGVANVHTPEALIHQAQARSGVDVLLQYVDVTVAACCPGWQPTANHSPHDVIAAVNRVRLPPHHVAGKFEDDHTNNDAAANWRRRGRKFVECDSLLPADDADVAGVDVPAEPAAQQA